MRFLQRFSAVLLVVLAGLTPCTKARDLLPVASLAKLPAFSKPVLSPDGKRLAATRIVEGKPLIYIHKLKIPADPTPERPVPVSAGDAFFDWYDWANNDRLLVRIRKTAKAQGQLLNVTRMVSVSRLGDPAVGFDMTPNQWGYYRQHVQMLSRLEHDPDHVLALLDDNPDLWAAPEVDRVNVNTGKKQRILKNPQGVMQWIADNDGVVRVGVRTKRRSTVVTIFYREDEAAGWEVLQKVSYFEHDRLLPIGFDKDDPNILLVSTHSDAMASQEGVETFRYDLAKREVVGHADFSGEKRGLRMVERQFPDRKVQLVSHDQARESEVFRVYSDVHPAEYYRLDIRRRKLEFLAEEYPAFAKAAFSPMQRLSYKARDGLEIPAYLTIPEGSDGKKLPLVVYPHGGPWAHDNWGWDNYVQFMASRGYAVLQPQFRGSTGFGVEHLEAGYGQWGNAIQDDITDGVEWLIDEGIADPDRICIVGSSFGGYAAAMGAAKTPELYRCAVSINGVLDLKQLIDSGRMIYFMSINRAVWNDRAGSEAFSPYHLAENIQAPILLIASEKDTVVPVSHSKKMRKRLRKLRKQVEYIELPDGEHWRSNEAHEITVMEALERFLGEHLQKG